MISNVTKITPPDSEHGTNLYQNTKKGSLGRNSFTSDILKVPRIRQSRRLSYGGGCVYSYASSCEELRSSVKSENSVGSNSSRSSIVEVRRNHESMSQRRRITGLKNLQNWRKGVVGRVKIAIQVKFLNEDEEMQYTATSVYNSLSLSKHSFSDCDATAKSQSTNPCSTGQLSSLTPAQNKIDIALARNKNDIKKEESWRSDIAVDGKNGQSFVSLTSFPIPTINEDETDTEEALNKGLMEKSEENEDEVKSNTTPSSNAMKGDSDTCDDPEQSVTRLQSSYGGRSSWEFHSKENESRRRLRPRRRMIVRLEIEKCEELRMTIASSRKIYKGRGRPDSSINPFVLTRLNKNEIGRTPALKNTNRPTWFDEIYEFPMCTHCKKLNFEVWNIKNYSREVGGCIGVATIDVRDLIEIHEGETEFLEYDLELFKILKDDNDDTNPLGQCSCPGIDGEGSVEDESTKQKSAIHSVTNFNFHHGLFKSVKNLAMKLSKSTHGRSLPLDIEDSERFKIENPDPFRRQDIREENKKENNGSFLTSSTSKAIYMIVGYMILGVLGFSLVFEKLTIEEALYLSVVTFTTVGYGDIWPKTREGKMFTCFFAFVGIGIIGVALGYIGQHLVQTQVAALQRKAQQADDEPRSSSEGETTPSGRSDECIEKSTSKIKNIIMAVGPVAAMVTFGAIVVGHLEKWTVVDSVYWCVMTGTSVGYGDFAPKKRSSRWFAIFFIPISVGVISHTLGRIANIFVEREIAKANAKLLQREVTLEDLEAMNADGDGEVSPLEFIEHMLLAMNKVDRKLLDQLHAQFDRLDADNSGGLQGNDLEILTRNKLEERRERALTRYRESLLSNNREHLRGSAPQISPTTL